MFTSTESFGTYKIVKSYLITVYDSCFFSVRSMIKHDFNNPYLSDNIFFLSYIRVSKWCIFRQCRDGTTMNNHHDLASLLLPIDPGEPCTRSFTRGGDTRKLQKLGAQDCLN